jgi:excisionase family DNA binding protein
LYVGEHWRNLEMHEKQEKTSANGLVSIAESCVYLNISRTGLYGMMRRGEIAYVKLGRRRLIPLKVLRNFVNNNTVQEKP